MVFTLNGKEYKTKAINFGALVELESYGLDITAFKSKSMTTIASLVAYHTELGLEGANEEIEKHLTNGGKITDLIVLVNDFARSDFFQKLQA